MIVAQHDPAPVELAAGAGLGRGPGGRLHPACRRALFGRPVSTNEWGGLPLTLLVWMIAFAGAFVVAVPLALARRSKMGGLRTAAIVVIELVRGVPMLVALYVSRFIVPMMAPGFEVNLFVSVEAALILFVASYLAEILRAGLQSLPRGQAEAASALGLGYWRTIAARAAAAGAAGGDPGAGQPRHRRAAQHAARRGDRHDRFPQRRARGREPRAGMARLLHDRLFRRRARVLLHLFRRLALQPLARTPVTRRGPPLSACRAESPGAF